MTEQSKGLLESGMEFLSQIPSLTPEQEPQAQQASAPSPPESSADSDDRQPQYLHQIQLELTAALPLMAKCMILMTALGGFQLVVLVLILLRLYQN